MSKQLLHDFEFCPDTPQESGVGVPERMPSESLLDSCPLRGRTNISAQDRLAPDRLAATVTSTRENPVIRFAVTADLFPFSKSLQDGWMNWHRLLGGFSLQDPTTPYTIDRVTFVVFWAKSISTHFTANSSL